MPSCFLVIRYLDLELLKDPSDCFIRIKPMARRHIAGRPCWITRLANRAQHNHVAHWVFCMTAFVACGSSPFAGSAVWASFVSPTRDLAISLKRMMVAAAVYLTSRLGSESLGSIPGSSVGSPRLAIASKADTRSTHFGFWLVASRSLLVRASGSAARLEIKAAFAAVPFFRSFMMV